MVRASEDHPKAPEPGAEAPDAIAVEPSARRFWDRVLDLGERVFCVVLFSALVARLAPGLGSQPVNGLMLVSEGLVVLFVVIRRRSIVVTHRPVDWIAALGGTVAPLLVHSGGIPLAPAGVDAGIILCGLIVGVWSKLTLRRSFGIAAANRGVVRSGPYALVRHPMYAGYILVYLGFFLVNPLAWNACILLLTVALMVYRVLAEERVLKRDRDYSDFMTSVRFRLAPGLF
jgi:protein-S-isoprenylcysteine O-methyltransferase Ste14